MRIIAGTLGGRRLTAPEGRTTRPTTDRVREAWFSMLARIEGRVLDLYAGTGALGFEALSRGADHCVFVESDRHAQRAILDNAESLGVRPRVTLLTTPLERSGSAIRKLGPYDLVLTDPPWTAIDDAEKALRRMLDAALFRPEGRLVLGHPRNRKVTPLPSSGLTETKSRNWGDSAATFFVFDPEAPSL